MFLPSTSGAVRRRAGPLAPAASARWTTRAGRLGPWLAVVIVVLLLGSSAGASASARAPSGPDVAGVSATISAAPSVHPAAPAPAVAPAVDPPCFSLNTTVCISMANTSEPNIVPPAGSHTSPAQPSSNVTLSLFIKSRYSLVWNGAHFSGAQSPIALNATGVLWNGDPYWNSTDGTIWHPTGSNWWSVGPVGTNTSYPYWYGVNFSARGTSGVPNFFPGMTLTWWVYFVENNSGTYSHWSSVSFTFTYGGAWPYSPDPGTQQYAGPAAASEDLSVAQNPLVPNFNDSVNVTISTTSADVVTGATIGGAYLDLTETAPDGTLLARSTLSFPVLVHGTVGQVQSAVRIPPTLAQDPGVLVQYTITAWDTNTYGPDQIETQSFNYTVNGNGTFASHIFGDDLALSTSPVGPGLGGTPPPTVPAGQAVQLLLASRDAGTAIFAAEVVYTFDYPAVNESVTGTIPFDRANSTHFAGTLPPMPLGAIVTFQVYAWDFAQDRDVSPTYKYVTPSLAALTPSVPTNSTFFLVYVYDNGTHTWVTGASVQVASASGYVHTYATSFDGVAYPNASGEAFVPLLLPAGEGYVITVDDPSYYPADASASKTVSVSLTAPHNLSQQGVLKVGPDYEVAESGNAVYFWLNESGPGVTYSAPVTANGLGILAAAVGLVAIALAVIPLLMWWSRIRARRLAQEKRITL
jgi:hypothetical protein